MYAELEQAFQSAARLFSFNQTTGSFKSSIGCATKPLSFFIQAVNPVLRFLLRHAQEQIFPRLRPFATEFL